MACQDSRVLYSSKRVFLPDRPFLVLSIGVLHLTITLIMSLCSLYRIMAILSSKAGQDLRRYHYGCISARRRDVLSSGSKIIFTVVARCFPLYIRAGTEGDAYFDVACVLTSS